MFSFCKIPFYLGNKGLLKWLPDELYLKLVFSGMVGYKLNLKNPKTLNEKIQWQKLYDHNPLYTDLVDKQAVKKYVAQIIGDQYIIPTIGVWKRFEDIDFEKLPNQFVLKCTHDSGGLVIVKDKSLLDYKKAKKKIESCLKKNYFWTGREWPYKNVKPQIIAEPYIEDAKTSELRDYKFFVFNGVPKLLFVASDRQTKGEEVKFDFYDINFKHIDVKNGHENSNKIIEKPSKFDEMVALAKKLSFGIPLVRVDFYEANGCTLFGEITLSHFSGFTPFEPYEFDELFGSWVDLEC